MSVRLKQLQVEAFRGFGEATIIPLDADAVVITGANGLGKTSVFQAIGWGLTGRLPALEERQDKKEEFLGNYYRQGQPSRVSLTLEADGSEYVIRREGNTQMSAVELISDARLSGSAAERALATLLGQTDLDAMIRAVSGWGILGQDEVRSVLTAQGEDLQKQLREILSLGVLDRFEVAAKKFYDDEKKRSNVARDAHKEIESRHNQVRTKLAEAQGATEHDVTGAVAEFRSTQAEYQSVLLTLPEELSPESVDQLIRRLTMVESEVAGLQLYKSQHDERERKATPGEIDGLGERLHELQNELASIAERRARLAGQRQSRAVDVERVVKLASAALPLLSDRCPVCSQAIDQQEVSAHLVEVRDKALESDPAFAQLSGELKQLEKSDESTRRALADYEKQMDEAKKMKMEVERSRAQLQAHYRRFMDEAAAFEMRLPELSADVFDNAALATVAVSARALGKSLGGLLIQVRASAADASLSKLRRDLGRLEVELEASAKTLEAASTSAAGADVLRKASLDAALDVTERALETIEPFFGEVYRRLAAHPTFQELSVRHEVYYGKARSWTYVEDPISKIVVNPKVVCSEGQLNVVTLSYFLALALTAGDSGLPFVALDDPLQTLDDANALGFSDLCRHIRDEKQLLVSSHERRFGELLSRKLIPRKSGQSLIVLDFVGWDRSGPTFTSRKELSPFN